MSLIGVIGSAARRRGGGAPSFDVLSLSPALWLDGSDPATMYDATSGGSLVAADGLIARLEDKSGNSRHATQSDSALRPVRKNSQFGSLGAIRFDADHWVLPNFLAGASGEVFYVCKHDADPSPSGANAGPLVGNFGSAGLSSVQPWTDGNIYEAFGSTTRHSCGNPVPSLANLHILHMSSQANLWFIRVNNSSLFSTATNTVGWRSDPQIGRDNVQGIWWFIGLMAEIIFIQSTLTETQRTDTANYLAAKWGIAI